MSYEKYQVADFLPEGEDGNWKVSRFTVSEAESKFDALRSLGRGGGMAAARTMFRGE